MSRWWSYRCDGIALSLSVEVLVVGMDSRGLTSMWNCLSETLAVVAPVLVETQLLAV